MIRVYSSFAEIEGELTRLYAVASSSGASVSGVGVTPFQSPAFLRSAWSFVDDGRCKLMMLAYEAADKHTAAVFPLYLDRRGALRFIADAHADFCNALIEPAYVGSFHMCEELASFIRSCREIRRVRLVNMWCDRFYSALGYQLGRNCVYINRRYSYFTVPSSEGLRSYIDGLRQLSTKERYRLKNIQTKMDAAGAAFSFFSAASGEAYPASLVGGLASAMVSEGRRKGSYFSEKFLGIVEAMYEAGRLAVAATFVGDEPAACNLLLLGSGEYIDWIALNTAPSYNIWNLLQCVSYISTVAPGSVLNMARGFYPYKLHNFKPAVASLHCLRFSKASRGGAVADFIARATVSLR